MASPARPIPFVLVTLFLVVLSWGSASAGDPVSFAAKAEALVARGEYERALDELKSGCSLFPYDESLRRSLVSLYARLARRDLSANRFREAADYFGQAHDLAPGAVELGFLRGVALYLGKEYDGARAEFLLAGEGVQPLLYLGRISYDTGDLPGALALWRRALEQAPGNQTLAGLIAKGERELPVESRMDRGYSSMFDLSFDAELAPGLAASVLDALESAYNRVGADLDLFPTTRIPVLLYAKGDYATVTAGPDWSGGLYDGKIRLPVGGLTRITPQLRGILFHEFTHVLIAEITHGNIPTWLNEGLAEVEGQKEFTPPGSSLVGKLVPFSELAGPFTALDGAQARAAYRQSCSLASFMVSRYGWYAVQGILRRLGERATIEVAVEKALSDWSLDLPGMIREWRAAGTAD